MKKITLILLSILLLFTVTACSGNKEDVVVTKSPEEIEQAIKDSIGEKNYYCDTDIDPDWLVNSYGLDLSQIESYVAKQNCISSINPDVVLVLKVKDGYSDTAVDLLKTIQKQMADYISLYPFGVAKVLNARIYQSGNYVMYIIAGASYEGSDSEQENKLAVSEYEKIDSAIKDIFGKLPKNLAEEIE